MIEFNKLFLEFGVRSDIRKASEMDFSRHRLINAQSALPARFDGTCQIAGPARADLRDDAISIAPASVTEVQQK